MFGTWAFGLCWVVLCSGFGWFGLFVYIVVWIFCLVTGFDWWLVWLCFPVVGLFG